MIPSCETSPSVGFRPTMFSTDEGPVIEPSVSVPIAAARAPPDCQSAEIGIERNEAAEVRPLAEVRLSEDHRAGGAQPLNDDRIARHAAAVDRQRPGSGLHVVVGGDVVFEQNRDAVQRATHVPRAPLVVELRRDRHRLGIGFDDGVQQRVQVSDALEIAEDELAAAQLAGRQHRLQL
jgi:hypothetical protein